jgi:hypothetical protein
VQGLDLLQRIARRVKLTNYFNGREAGQHDGQQVKAWLFIIDSEYPQHSCHRSFTLSI